MRLRLRRRADETGRETLITGRNIICFASNWAYDPTSKHHVMRLLSEENHVIWVNYHASRRPSASAADLRSVSGKLGQVIRGPRRIDDNLTILTPMVIPLPGNAIARRSNGWLIARQIRQVLQQLPERPIQLWSFAPDVSYLCGRFDEECVVYYCVDAFSEFTGYDRQAIEAAERDLMAAANLVVTTSRDLFDSKRPFNANTVQVNHGVDFDHFVAATSPELAVPSDVAALPGPVLGFWGLLQDWLDVELLAGVAAARPAWSLALVGEAATDLSALSRLPNVHLLGRRPYSALPAYAKAFDIGLVPFRMNDLTRAVNPIKLREYLSAGLPVVSTPLPEVAAYASLVEFGSDVSSFVGACEAALRSTDSGSTQHRQAAMSQETWAGKVEELSYHVEAVCSGSSRKHGKTVVDSGATAASA